jgi:uncharacterized protein (DUF1684 family)
MKPEKNEMKNSVNEWQHIPLHLKYRGMRNSLLPLILGLLFLGSCKDEPIPANPQEAQYVEIIYSYRAQKDQHFASADNSPLLQGDKEVFSGLKYFPVNPEMRFTLELHKFEQPDTIEIMTTGGSDRFAWRYGYFDFVVEKKTHRLYVYKFLDAKNNGYLFIPFLDQSAGKETYGGGRYLDLVENESGIYELDFNMAYNPSCAYGRKEYVCPIPPSENTLGIAIYAGEKAWLEK